MSRDKSQHSICCNTVAWVQTLLCFVRRSQFPDRDFRNLPAAVAGLAVQLNRGAADTLSKICVAASMLVLGPWLLHARIMCTNKPLCRPAGHPHRAPGAADGVWSRAGTTPGPKQAGAEAGAQLHSTP
jgi:hypothetical protein